ncbi:hypothetical protein LRP88_12542 [Fusarium phalaenopsidis]
MTFVKTDGMENTVHVVVLPEALDIGVTDRRGRSDTTQGLSFRVDSPETDTVSWAPRRAPYSAISRRRPDPEDAALVKEPRVLDLGDGACVSGSAEEEHGKLDFVKLLLEDSSVDEPRCLDAIMAAARSGEFGVLDILLKYATGNFNIVQWPGFLTSRLAYLGPIYQLKTILQATGDANSIDADYSPPLHCAIMRNNTVAFDTLIGHGADPAVTNSNWKNTPAILVAAKHGRVDMAKRLTEAGASVDVYDNRGRCALWLAAVTGQHLVLQALEVPREGSARPPIVSLASVPFLKCLKLALEFGADPNNKLLNEEHPSSALSIAARWGLLDGFRVLLEAGAHHDTDDDPPLIHAVNSGKREIVEMLLEKGAKVDAKLEYGDFQATPLIIAAQRDYQDLVKLLIEREAGVDTDVWEGSTALHYAIGGDNLEMVKFLVDSGANTGQTQSGEWSALHKCYAKADCMKALLEAGADLNWAEPDGTALHLAVYYNALDVAELILSYRPDLEVKWPSEKSWDSGYTALHVAASYGFIEMLRLLIEAGADLKSTTPMGGTPLILAVANNSDGCTRALLDKDVPLVEFLLDKKVDINAAASSSGAALIVGAGAGDLGMVKLLVRKGADVNLTHPWMYSTALQKAYMSRTGTEEGRDAVARFLVDEADADVNAHGGVHGSALDAALLYGTVKAAKFLIERGADVGWKDAWGRRPVHFAALRTPGHFQLLLDSVSDMDDDSLGIATKTNLGHTLLHFAVASGSTDLVELVLSRTRGKTSINEPDEDGWTPLLWAEAPP